MAEYLDADPADTLADMFSIHHLVWLYRYNYISDAPYDLGPFPATLDINDTGRFDVRIQKDLVKWGILVPAGKLVSDEDPRTEDEQKERPRTGAYTLHPDAKLLFEALIGDNEWALLGTVLLYSLKTNAREQFDPDKVDEFGLIHAVRDVPRVKFVIAVTPREIMTALNAPPQLILNRVPRVGNIYKQVGEMFKLMLDPNKDWKPWPGPKASVPWSTVKVLSDNPDTSKMGEDEDARATQAAEVKSVLSDIGVSSNTSKVLENLVTLPTTAAVRVALSYTSPKGKITPDVGLGVTFFDDEEKGGVVVSYPVGRTSQTRSIRYVPGDGQGFIEAVESIVTLTEESLDA